MVVCWDPVGNWEVGSIRIATDVSGSLAFRKPGPGLLDKDSSFYAQQTSVTFAEVVQWWGRTLSKGVSFPISFRIHLGLNSGRSEWSSVNNVLLSWFRWSGDLQAISALWVQWGEHWVLVSMWGLQDHSFFGQSAIQGQANVCHIYWRRGAQRGTLAKAFIQHRLVYNTFIFSQVKFPLVFSGYLIYEIRHQELSPPKKRFYWHRNPN